MQLSVIFPCFHLMFWWCLWWCCRTWKFTFSSGQCPELPLQWGGCAAQHWVMLYVTWFNQSSHGGAVYCNVAPSHQSHLPSCCQGTQSWNIRFHWICSSFEKRSSQLFLPDQSFLIALELKTRISANSLLLEYVFDQWVDKKCSALNVTNFLQPGHSVNVFFHLCFSEASVRDQALLLVPADQHHLLGRTRSLEKPTHC